MSSAVRSDGLTDAMITGTAGDFRVWKEITSDAQRYPAGNQTGTTTACRNKWRRSCRKSTRTASAVRTHDPESAPEMLSQGDCAAHEPFLATSATHIGWFTS